MLVRFRNQVAPFAEGFKEAVNRQFEGLKERKVARRSRSAKAEDIDEQVRYIEQAIR